jgi:hypothetical protein
MDRVAAAVKWLASFTKRSWALEDYPVRVLEREAHSSGVRDVPSQWTALIVNWWHMRGDGRTHDEALDRLRERFLAYSRDSPLPRPGRGAPFKFEIASQDIVTEFAPVVHRILREVIGLDPDQCLITDESTLWDFHDGESNQPFLDKIKQVFGVDVSTVEPPTLSAIAQHVEKTRRTTR